MPRTFQPVIAVFTQMRALPGYVFHAPYPNEYKGLSAQDALAALDNIFATSIRAEDVAGIIIEPVQGEGGLQLWGDAIKAINAAALLKGWFQDNIRLI